MIDISATDIHLIEEKYGKGKTKILGKLYNTKETRKWTTLKMCKEQGAETREICKNGFKNELQETFPNARQSVCEWVYACVYVWVCFFLTACRSILLPSWKDPSGQAQKNALELIRYTINSQVKQNKLNKTI